MKLVIAEYLRTLRERDELDRLLPDLLVEMDYVPVARPQTGNRQYGVDIAARSLSDRKISKTSIEKAFQLCQFETYSVPLNIMPYISYRYFLV